VAVLRSLFGEHAEILHETNFRLLVAATVLPILGTSLLSPVLDSLTGPFGTSAANIGLMISAYTAPHVLAIPVMGALADRYGRKPILVAGLVIFGVAGLAIPLTTEFSVVLGLRLLQGVGGAGLNPIIIISIGDLYAGNREETAQGLRFAASGLSGAVIPLIAGAIVVVGWRYPFAFYALSFPVAVAVWRWLDEPTDADAPAADGGSRGSYLGDLRALFGYRRVQVMVLARLIAPLGWFGFITFNSIVVVRLLGSTAAVAGFLTAVASVVFAVVASQAGRLTAAFDSRLYPLIGANLCLAVGLGLLPFSPSVPVATVAVAVLGVGNGITLSLYRSILTDLAPQSLRGGLVSVSEAGGWVTATLAPVVIGALIAVGTPVVGFRAALQLSLLGAGLVAGLVGAGCMLALAASAPVPAAPGTGPDVK
jgi:MFS family permease